MKRIVIYCAIIFWTTSCGEIDEKPTIPNVTEDSIDIFQLETESTFDSGIEIHIADYEKYISIHCELNGEDIDLFNSFAIDAAGYYELSVIANTEMDTISDLIQFVVLDTERGEAEWGLRKFTPEPITESVVDVNDLQFLYPSNYPQELSLPIIIRSKYDRTEWDQFYANMQIDNSVLTLKRGVGSVLLSPERSTDILKVELQNQIKDIVVSNYDQQPTELSGPINMNTTLASGGYYHIVDDVMISASTRITIPEGCVIKVNEGVNIYNEGEVVIQGEETNPTVFVCANPNSYWGGFVTTGAESKMDVSHAIFIQSGFHDGPDYQYGHASRQALFYHDNSELEIRNSYAIDNIGQVFYLRNNSKLSIDNSLVQRAISAGGTKNSEVVISNSTFTDFPDDGLVYKDQDNDCMYLSSTNAHISNSDFMWSKDDGIDSGSSGGGHVIVDNCHFEGVFHEGLALSSGGDVVKKHEIRNCTFENCGQGVELGYSSPNHDVVVSNSHFQNNMIGIRYGDNYNRDVLGFMELSDCTFEENRYKDIWNFVRAQWSSREEGLVY